MELLLWLALLLADDPPKPKEEARPIAAQATTTAAPANLLGRTDTQAGEARRNENLFITAIDNNAAKESNNRLGTTATAVEDFSTAARYFGAEFGLAPTALLHLARSKSSGATNGAVQWSHANSIFAARSFFQVGGVKPARENGFAGRLSMPLWRNAFLSVEGGADIRRGFVNGNVLVPKASERSCLATDPAICAVIDRFFRAYPNEAPNVGERSLNTNAAQAIDTVSSSARLDQVLGKHRWNARHTWTNQQVDAFQLVAGQNPDTTTKAHDARMTWTYQRGPASVLDVSAGFNRARTLLVPEPNAVGPQVQIGTALEKLGPASQIPVDRIQNRYRLAARYQTTIGMHTLSVTGDLGRLHFNGREASSNRGNIYFRNDFGRDALTNFRLGVVNRYSFGVGEIGRGFRRWETGFGVSDNWRVHPRLLLNYGLRYQPQMGIREVNGLNDIPFDCDCNNAAPFLGFALRGPKGWGVFRGAYATQYGEVFPATLQQLRWNPPGFQKIENQKPPLLNLLEGIVLDPNARAIVFRYPRDLRTPYSHQYNFAWQTPLPRSLGNLTLSYVGSRTWKLLYMQYLNRAEPHPRLDQITATINDRRPDPRYFDYREVGNTSRAYFDAARVNYSLPTRRGLTVEASYWFSKAIDLGSTYLNIAAGDDASQGHSQTATGIAADLKGTSLFDQRHAVLSRVTYVLPSRHWLARGWRLSSVFLAKSGLPFNVITGSDAPGYGNVDGVTGDRPNILRPEILGRTIGHPDDAPRLLPREAFGCIAPTDPRGNLGVNVFRRAGFRNLNLGLERRFPLRQDRALAFRGESINALNTPQFADPIADLSNPSFGQINNTLNDGRAFRFTLSLEF
jgi:hypothetical protein